MDAKKLSSIEIDAIGEILNISLGASATAVSTMLDARVDITTPVVTVKTKEEFEFEKIQPAVGVEITYVDGLSGSNVMLLKRQDVKVIVEMLMGMEMPDEEFELNEMNISAICEVMNQMMGASSTALSELLSKTVNISTPISFEVESTEQFKDKYFSESAPMVVVKFTLRIADKLESEFMNLMPIELSRELVGGFFPDGVPGMEESEPEQPAASQPAAAPEQPSQEMPAAVQPEPVSPQAEAISSPQMPAAEPAVQQAPMQQAPVQMADSGMMSQMTQMMDMMRQQMEMQQQQIQQMTQKSGPRKIKVNSAPTPNLTDEGEKGELQDANLELIMGVPLDVSVEIGRTKKLVKDILEMNKGSLVVLDKLAGEQVDLFVNGQCIAKGDVVVVEDNFGIRITEILQDEIALLEKGKL